MDKPAAVKKALIEALGITPNLAITAEVVSVENTTCTIKLVSDLVLSDVRLCATISESQDLFLITPKIGSEVIVMSQTGKLSELIVVKVDSVQKMDYKLGDFVFSVDGTTKKVTIKNASANLGLLMNELIDTISDAQIITQNGPGTINPATVAQLNTVKTKFNSILNTI